METSDLTIEILTSIRDEIHATREELRGEIHQLGGRIDETNARLDLTNHRLGSLERRQVESEVRISTELVALAGAVREVTEVLKEERGSRVRVDDHERRITALEKRRRS
jgi:chromosome segregation ATPase